MLNLKEAIYDLPRLAKVAYLVYRQTIYFSGITKPGSTINFAEQVVLAICKAEGIRWQDYTFVDVETFRGYPGYAPGSYCIDQLAIVNDAGKPRVESWREIACRNWGTEDKLINETIMPKEVYQTFIPLIFSEDVLPDELEKF